MLYLFDLDGTLISGYMDNPDKDYHRWEVLPGRVEKIASLIAHGHEIGIVTNQGGVAFGIVGEDDFRRKVRKVADLIGFDSVAINGDITAPVIGPLPVFVCYADKRSKDPRYQDDRRRKPSGAMIVEASVVLGYPLSEMFYIGDRPEDEGAANAAGVTFLTADEFFI